ncbi:MAG: hypothetical protein Q4G09_04790 [Clostridia bacterium]|nr:hypothetical protein [Clostridia bacterium]
MNKKTKIIVIVFIILIICLGYMFMIDRSQTLNLKEPIFARLVSVEETYPSTSIYKGIGYTIRIKKDSNIISVTMIMFNKVVAASIT